MSSSKLLVAATAQEIQPFLQWYRQSRKSDWDILITGVGLPSSIYSLTKQFLLKRPRLVVQAGIGGCFDKKIQLGSIVAIGEDRFADLGVVEKKEFLSIYDLGFENPNKKPYSNGWLVNPHKALRRKTRLKFVKGISVNQVTTDPGMIQLFTRKYKPVVESMEGAGIHFVCLREGIPFLQLRGISNYIGERNKKNWKIKEAIHHLNIELIRMVEAL